MTRYTIFAGRTLFSVIYLICLTRYVQCTSVCYENVGCFYTDQGALGHVPTLPNPPEYVDHHFNIYSVVHKEEPFRIRAVDVSPENLTLAGLAVFDPSLPVKIETHGFANNGYDDWLLASKDIFLEREPTTVVVLDWEKGSQQGINYFLATRNAELAGRQLGNLMKAMMVLGVSPGQMHLIGHSLGAHIMNFAVNWVREDMPGFSPARISGLDPAHPLFCDAEHANETFLDASDADFVDIIHSNMGPLILGYLGCTKNLGHVDFYPNGGRLQPGCPEPIVGALEDLLTGQGEEDDSSHRRALYLFVESLADPGKFKSFPCPGVDDFDSDFLHGACFSCEAFGVGCSHMGYYADQHSGTGPQYLSTFSQNEDQFAGNLVRMSVTSSPSQADSTFGQFVVTILEPGNGSFGPFEITKRNEMIEEGSTKSLVALLPESTKEAWDRFIQVRLEYNAHDGVFVDGETFWFIDEVTVAFENEKRFCYFKPMALLESGRPKEITLSLDEC